MTASRGPFDFGYYPPPGIKGAEVYNAATAFSSRDMRIDFARLCACRAWWFAGGHVQASPCREHEHEWRTQVREVQAERAKIIAKGAKAIDDLVGLIDNGDDLIPHQRERVDRAWRNLRCL